MALLTLTILLAVAAACDATYIDKVGKLYHYGNVLNKTVSAGPRAGLNKTVSAGPVPTDCLHCICMLESKCKMLNPVCRMDVGSLSCGPYQLKDAYWQDAREKGGSLDGDWQKCSATFECSEQAVQGYMMRYATEGRIRHNPTCEDFARIHGGGINGYKDPNTMWYWALVKSCLDG